MGCGWVLTIVVVRGILGGVGAVVVVRLLLLVGRMLLQYLSVGRALNAASQTGRPTTAFFFAV